MEIPVWYYVFLLYRLRWYTSFQLFIVSSFFQSVCRSGSMFHPPPPPHIVGSFFFLRPIRITFDFMSCRHRLLTGCMATMVVGFLFSILYWAFVKSQPIPPWWFHMTLYSSCYKTFWLEFRLYSKEKQKKKKKSCCGGGRRLTLFFLTSFLSFPISRCGSLPKCQLRYNYVVLHITTSTTTCVSIWDRDRLGEITFRSEAFTLPFNSRSFLNDLFVLFSPGVVYI